MAVFFFSPYSARAFTPNFLWGAAASSYQTEGQDQGSDWWDWSHLFHRVPANDDGTQHFIRFAEDFELASSLHLNSMRISLSWARLEPTSGHFSDEAFAHYEQVLQTMWQRGLIPMVALEHFVHPSWFNADGSWANDQSDESFARFTQEVVTRLGHLIPLWITFNEPTVQVTEGFLKGNYPPGHRNFEQAVLAYTNIVRAHLRATKIIHAGAQNENTACDRARALVLSRNPNRTDAASLPAGPLCGVGLALNMHAFLPAHSEGDLAEQDAQAINILERLSTFAFLEAALTGRLHWNIPALRALPAYPTGHQINLDLLESLVETTAPPATNPVAPFKLDWVGANYYNPWTITRDVQNDLGLRWIVPAELPNSQRLTSAAEGSGLPQTDLNWIIYPEGLRQVLLNLNSHASGLPLLVTENGIADAADSRRQSFLENHIEVLRRTLQSDHVEVRGYYTWSLTDNYEWLEGHGPRFGLFEIDYVQGFKRLLRPSAVWLRAFLNEQLGGADPHESAPPKACRGFVLNFWQQSLSLPELQAQILRASSLGACHFTIPLLFCQPNITSSEMEWCATSAQNLSSAQGVLQVAQAITSLGFSFSTLPIVMGSDGSWRGQFRPSEPELWLRRYRELILETANQMRSLKPRDFVIASEVNLLYQEFPEFWRQLLNESRQILRGEPSANPTNVLIAANWDQFQDLPFWDSSDLVGVSAYFPLISATIQPSPVSLLQGWSPWLQRLRQTSLQFGKKIFFVELGYASRDNAAQTPWEHGPEQQVNLDLQRLLFQVLRSALESLENEFYSFDLWSLEPTRDPHADTGFDIFGKPAQSEVELLLRR